VAEQLTERVYTHFHFFCGLGGGAKGFNKGTARVGNLSARLRCIGGIDVDAASIRDFERLAGCRGTVLDLFSRDQYIAFHGHEPPADWREATPQDIRDAAGGEFPDIVFLSAPCKGFSGLLSERTSQTAKYQALNELTLRGVWLMMEAFRDHPPKLVIFENVPRIATRGRPLVDQIKSLMGACHYAGAETTHDCGEIGGLAQSRKRFLMVFRHQPQVAPFLYEPRKLRLRGVGEVLEQLPLPGDTLTGGPMHRIPMLQWKTWVRLAFVEAGSDWRSLNRLAIEDGFLRDFGILPDRALRNGALGVGSWEETAALIAGESLPSNGRFAVADPLTRHGRDGSGFLGVRGWEDHAQLVTGNGRPGSGPHSVADPRVDGHPKSVQLGVRRWTHPAAVVKGDVSVGTGPYAVADPRAGRDGPRFNNVYRIVPWGGPSPAVTGQGGNSAGAVADPRAEAGRHVNGKYRVTPFDGPANAVIAGSTTGNGAYVVADPRATWGPNSHRNKLKVIGYDQRASTIMGADRVGSGALSVADPRHPGLWGNGQLGVNAWGDHTGVVTSARSPLQGGFSVADPRHFGLERPDSYGVLEWDQRSGAVIGSAHAWDTGRFSVADPRPDCLQGRGPNDYGNGGHYGVVAWRDFCGAVPASGQHDNGPWSVADPRPDHLPDVSNMTLPAPTDRLVCAIRALDDTWHRPFTTLELAALQSLFDPEEEFSLDGQSDSAWRERIGNAVPSDAAAAVASVMAKTLLLAEAGETFVLSAEPIWVNPTVRQLEIALSVDTGALP
jgi:site-specific DNA-cytosine methylase